MMTLRLLSCTQLIEIRLLVSGRHVFYFTYHTHETDI